MVYMWCIVLYIDVRILELGTVQSGPIAQKGNIAQMGNAIPN